MKPFLSISKTKQQTTTNIKPTENFYKLKMKSLAWINNNLNCISLRPKRDFSNIRKASWRQLLNINWISKPKPSDIDSTFWFALILFIDSIFIFRSKPWALHSEPRVLAISIHIGYLFYNEHCKRWDRTNIRRETNMVELLYYCIVESDSFSISIDQFSRTPTFCSPVSAFSTVPYKTGLKNYSISEIGRKWKCKAKTKI